MLRRSRLKRSLAVSKRVFVPFILDCLEKLKHCTDLHSIEFVEISFVENLEFYDIQINNEYLSRVEVTVVSIPRDSS